MINPEITKPKIIRLTAMTQISGIVKCAEAISEICDSSSTVILYFRRDLIGIFTRGANFIEKRNYKKILVY